jgi:hypothetical protein
MSGYEQDVFASRYLKQNDPAAYERFMGDEKSPLPIVPKEYLPPVAGLDNAKVGVLKDGGKNLAEELTIKPDDTNLVKLDAWWKTAETTAAAIIHIASTLGIPVSTTHTITGAIVGVGSTRKVSAVRWGVAGNIVWAWIFTIPASAFIAAVSWWLGTQVL